MQESKRICKQCGIEKDITSFKAGKNTKGCHFVYWTCKACQSKQAIERANKYRAEMGDDAWRELQRNRQRRTRSKKTPEQRREQRKSWPCEAGNRHMPLDEYKVFLKKRSEEKRRKTAPRKMKSTGERLWREWEKRQEAELFLSMFDFLKEHWCIPGRFGSLKYRAAYNTDERFAIRERIRRQIRKKYKEQYGTAYVASIIKKKRNNDIVTHLVGADVDAVVSHLESTLSGTGKTWDHFVNGDLHIDHIIPKSLFDIHNENESKLAWNINNLRLVDKGYNMRKGVRVVASDIETRKEIYVC